MISKNVNGQTIEVCPVHGSMKNILTSIAEEANREINEFLPKKPQYAL